MTNGSAKILVIDDELHIRRALFAALSAAQYEVLLAGSGEEGVRLAIESTPDMVVLDLVMPGMNGIEVCRVLRQWFNAPILILSVNGRETDKIAALDAGADDYLTKPYSSAELLARIRALLRRARLSRRQCLTLTMGPLCIDFVRHSVTFDGEEIRLTPIEYEVLSLLARNANCVVTTRTIIEHIWGNTSPADTSVLRVHISNLRRKLDPNGEGARYIVTEPAIGFRLVTEDE